MRQPTQRTNTVRVVQGQTKILSVEVKDRSGRILKLHGATVLFSVRPDLSTGPVLMLSSGDGSISITDAGAGVAVVTISSSQTESLPKGRHLYDVWVIFDGDPPVRHPVVRMAELWVEESVTQFP